MKALKRKGTEKRVLYHIEGKKYILEGTVAKYV